MRVDIAVKDTETTVKDLVRALSNNLSAVDNFKAKIITIADSGPADTEFAVIHGLEVIPTFYIWNVNKNAVVYDSRRVDWTASQMFLKVSAANAAVTLIVM